jgi:1-deoxy-D-xylulose-5-phosphate reductoisomerase
MSERKKIAILGSTGSIGTQALEVLSAQRDFFSVEVLTAGENADLLIRQANLFKPKTVVIANEKKFEYVRNAIDKSIQVFAGRQALLEIVESEIDMVLTAMVGYAGLEPTVRALQAGKDIALSNKETLVVAGDLITRLARQNNCKIIPVDSEHSAIFQSIVGENENKIEKIYLTASGGPFRGKDLDFLQKVTKQQALKHPNWNMGAKITIDSASLMNKGLEVIEAKWLFDLEPAQIDVIVHPQSVIHSIVQFTDGSMKAQMGLPDMKLPILYALAFPKRMKSSFERFNFMNYPQLTFEKPDTKVFRNLDLAFKALQKGGNMPCILNAANEVVVEAFLNDKIQFLEMPDIIEKTLESIDFKENLTLNEYIETDSESRKTALKFLNF